MNRIAHRGVGYLVPIALGFLVVFLFPAILVGAGEDSGSGSDDRETLTVSGPPDGLVTLPFFRMIETDALAGESLRLRYIPWKNPAQLRAVMAGKQADIVGLPTNVAANFHNRGVMLKMMNVSVWTVLWVASEDPEIHSLEDLRGEEIVIPFKGDLPEIVFNLTARARGLDPDRDFNVRFAAGPVEAARLLLLGRAGHALLSEPSCSLAIIKSRGKRIRPLYRAVDLQLEWGKAFDTPPRIALAGLAAMPGVTDRPDLLRRLHEEYGRAIQWCRENPTKAGKILNRWFPSIEPEVGMEAIRAAHWEAVDAVKARPAIEQFLRALEKQDPGKIGGKLPSKSFYWQPGINETESERPSKAR